MGRLLICLFALLSCILVAISLQLSFKYIIAITIMLVIIFIAGNNVD